MKELGTRNAQVVKDPEKVLKINSGCILKYAQVIIIGTIRKAFRGWWVVRLVLKVSQVAGEEGAETKKVIEVVEYMWCHSTPVPRSTC